MIKRIGGCWDTKEPTAGLSGILSVDEMAGTLIGHPEPCERQLLYRRCRLETAEPQEPVREAQGNLEEENPFLL